LFANAIAIADRLRFSTIEDLNGIAIPVWASGIAFVIAAALAIMLWREARR